MANKYKWKGKGVNVVNPVSVTYISAAGSSNGNGSITNPYGSSTTTRTYTSGTRIFNYSGGFTESVLVCAGQIHAFGQGEYESTVKVNARTSNSANIYLYDMTIGAGAVLSAEGSITLNNCILDTTIYTANKSQAAYNSLIRNRLTNVSVGSNCCCEGITYSAIPTSSSVFDRCNIAFTTITAANANQYKAFDNCLFKIGNEAEYTALTGNTETELRQAFIDRCAAQGISAPNAADVDETAPLVRWVFAKGASANGVVLEGSIFDSFQSRKAITLGRQAGTYKSLPLTAGQTTPMAIESKLLSGSFVIENGALKVSPSIDLSRSFEGNVTFKPFWLGGLKKLSDIITEHNLSMLTGMSLDTTTNMGDTPITDISELEPQQYYVVRSTDNNAATVNYNGTTYSSQLSLRANIFLTWNTHNTFTLSANAVVYKVLDVAAQPTVDIRIVHDIPAQKITSGNVQSGYWYFVAPNDLADQTGKVRYKGIDYPVMCAFLADDNTAITVNGACHLRRMWREEYTQASEVTDAAFWANTQKPIYTPVMPSYPYCLKKNNSEYNPEMKTDSEGNYIASGHPDFFALTNGDTGVLSPSFPIEGAFIQLRIRVANNNFM